MTFLYISSKGNICCASQLYKDICTKICCNIWKWKTRPEITKVSAKRRLSHGVAIWWHVMQLLARPRRCCGKMLILTTVVRFLLPERY